MKNTLRSLPVVGSALQKLKRDLVGIRDKSIQEKLFNSSNPFGIRISKVLDKVLRQQYENIEILREIESHRHAMLKCTDPLVNDPHVVPGLYDVDKSVRDACLVSKSKKSASLMYLLVCEFAPSRVIELGTNVGISAAYFAAALDAIGKYGKIVTIEASPFRLALAQRLHKALDLKNVLYKQGLFSEVLPKTLETFSPIDLAFIDGHHQYKPTIEYFELILQYTSHNAIFIFDDIRWSADMARAWNVIQKDSRVSLAVDLSSIGICVASKEKASQKLLFPEIQYVLS